MSTNKSIITLICEVFKMLFSMFFKQEEPRYTLEEYLNILNPVIDEMISDEEKAGAKYMGGICKVQYMPAKMMQIKFTIEFFFKKADSEKWIKKSIVRELEENIFVEETIERLREDMELEFEINSPPKERSV